MSTAPTVNQVDFITKALRQAIRLTKAGVTNLMDLGAKETALCAYYVALSWVYELFPIVGILRAIGPMGSGKSRLIRTVLQPVLHLPFEVGGSQTQASMRRDMIEAHRAGRRTLVCDDVAFDAPPGSERVDLFISRCRKGGKASFLGPRPNGGWESVATEVFGPTLLGRRLPFIDLAVESRCLDIPMGTQQRTGRNLPLAWDGSENDIQRLLTDFRNGAINLQPVMPPNPGVADRGWDIGWSLIYLADLAGDSDGVKYLLDYLIELSEAQLGDRTAEPAVLVVAALVALGATLDPQSGLLTLPTQVTPIPLKDIREQVWTANRVALTEPQVGKILRQMGLRNEQNIFVSGGYTKLRGLDWHHVRDQARRLGLQDELLEAVP